MNYQNVDKVIAAFYRYLPHGNNYHDSDEVYKLEYREKDEILKFLKDEQILVIWGDSGKLILSKKGIEIVEIYKGIEEFLDSERQSTREAQKLENAKNQITYSTARLSKWKVRTFPFFFIVSLIGGMYSIFSIIMALTKESDDQKIERMVNEKLKEKTEKLFINHLGEKKDSLVINAKTRK